MPERQFWEQVKAVLDPPVTRSGARANRERSYLQGTFARSVKIAVVAAKDGEMRVELSSSNAGRKEALRAIAHATNEGALTPGPDGAACATRVAPKDPNKLNLEFVWYRGCGYMPELPRVRELIRWFHEVARELLDGEGAEFPAGGQLPEDSGATGDTEAGRRWRLRRTRFALTGWEEHPHAERLRNYSKSLLGPIVTSWKTAPEPDAVRAAAKWMLNQIVWAYTTLHDAAKYDTRYISERAKPQFEELQQALAEHRLSAAKREILPQLRHEHVHTRSDVVEALLAGDVGEALENAAACVVTIEDHCALDDATGNGWDRYADAGIRVWDRAGGDWAILVAALPPA